MLDTWNQYNIVYQLYFNKNKNIKWSMIMIAQLKKINEVYT